MAKTTVCLHGDDSVRPTLVGKGHPRMAAVEIIAAGATTMAAEGRDVCRVGVLITVDEAITKVGTLDPIQAMAIIRGALDQCTELLCGQFGEDVVDAALMADIDPDPEPGETIQH